MLQSFKDYARCAVRNKLIIGSYVGIGLSVLIKYIEHETGTEILLVDDVLLYSSVGILGITDGGRGTYKAYRRMKEHIARYKTIDPQFKNRFSSLYCTQVGLRMAAEEASLEKLL